ncbi:hypothetical protein [Streptomyces sp. NPDC093094]|uniref:hypothetical protein n=1 Tax=Streptomyces sp. NPDC093094 TaxID=3366026 RepID=UPI0038238AE5
MREPPLSGTGASLVATPVQGGAKTVVQWPGIRAGVGMALDRAGDKTAKVKGGLPETANPMK